MNQTLCFFIIVLPLISSSSEIIPPVLHGSSNLCFFPLICLGNRTLDLYGENQTDFTNLITQWTLVNVNNPFTYSDDNVRYLGGLNILRRQGSFERTYSSLPPHSTLYYYIKLTMFGVWIPQDGFEIYINDNMVSSWNNIPNTINIAGMALNDSGIPISFNIVGSMLHLNPVLKIKISSIFTSNVADASFGIRDVEFLFSNGSSVDALGTCTKYPAHTASCDSCEGHMYLNSLNNFCTSCHSNCKECFGPQANHCYACQSNKYYSGYECLNCYSGCFSCSGPSQNQCITCDPGLILYWNNTCQLSCNAPYLLKGTGQYKTCETHCQSTNKYMLWNNTCIDSCEHPLVSEIQGQAKLCRFPCNNSNNEFAYWNRSCKSSCPYYQRNENGYKFCDPCQSSEYFLYEDDKCYPTCPTGYQRNDSKAKFCDFPCYGAQKYYNIQNNICLSECVYPSYVQNEVFCIFVSQNKSEHDNLTTLVNEHESISNEAKGVSSAINTGSKVGMMLANVNSLLNSDNPSAFCFLALNEMLQYIKFMKIKYSPKLQQMLDLNEEGLFSLIPELPNEIRNKFPKHALPVNFEKYEIDSSFFVNFWQQLITLLIIGLVIGMCKGLGLCFKKCKLLNVIIKKILKVLKWNYVIMLFTSYSGKIGFYGSFELRTIDIDAFLPALSLLFCIFSHILASVVFIKMIQAVKSHYSVGIKSNNSNRIEKLIIIKRKWKDYQVIFDNCKEDSITQKAFLPLFVLRIALFHFIISYLFDHPLVQASLITFIGILMLLYLSLARPLKEKSDLVNYIIQEIIILIVNSCTLTSAILDDIDIDASKTRAILGDIIIYSNLSFGSIGLMFMMFQTSIQLKNLFKMVKERWKRNSDKHDKSIVNSSKDPTSKNSYFESSDNTMKITMDNTSSNDSFIPSLLNTSTINQNVKTYNDLGSTNQTVNNKEENIIVKTSPFLQKGSKESSKTDRCNKPNYLFKNTYLKPKLHLNKLSGTALDNGTRTLAINSSPFQENIEEISLDLNQAEICKTKKTVLE